MPDNPGTMEDGREVEMRVLAALIFFCSVGLLAQSGCIRGVVLDPAGAPIGDIGVIALDTLVNGGVEVTTRSDGTFEITVLPPATYQLSTSDDIGRLNQALRKDAKPSITSPSINVGEGETCSEITLHRPARARLRLNVTDSLTGESLKHVQAHFRSAASAQWLGTANEKGELLVPPLNEIEVVVGANGYQQSEILKFSQLPPGHVGELAIELRPVQTGCLTGTVVDQQGVPVAGVGVMPGLSTGLDADVAMKKTGKNGRFVFRGLHPGGYFVFTHAELLGYGPMFSQEGFSSFTPIEVPASAGCQDLTIKLGPKAARLHVKVLDLDTQKAIVAPNLSMVGEKWSMKLFEDMPLAPALKQFNLTVSARGYKMKTVTISPLQPEQDQDITIELLPDGKEPQ